MPSGDRNQNGPILAFVLTIILLIVGLIGWFEGFERGTERNEHISSQSYKHQSDAEIGNKCSRISSGTFRECVAKAVRTAREQQRGEEDLHAQQQMAYWAKWMLFSTVAMSAITLFGVVFVWQTLVTTQKWQPKLLALARRKRGPTSMQRGPSSIGTVVREGTLK